MKKSRFTDSQILSVLKQAENGIPVPELCREHGAERVGEVGARLDARDQRGGVLPRPLDERVELTGLDALAGQQRGEIHIMTTLSQGSP